MAENCLFDVTPLATTNVVANTPIYNINYTSQDYNSIRTRMLELLKSNFANDFNDFTESSLAVMLIECWAFLGDLLSFKIDQIANELFIDTVTEPENAFRLAKLVGFKPQPPLPAKAMFMVSLNSIYSLDVVIKAPLVVILEYGASEVRYELYPADVNNNPVFNQSIVIPSGNLFNSAVVGLEGHTTNLSYSSNGNSYQSFQLPYSGIFDGSISVSVNNVPWEQVEYFTESRTLPEYLIEYSSDYKVTLIFGNGKAGFIPPNGANIHVKFRTANSTTSEIVTGAFESKTYVNVQGIPHTVIVSTKNYTKSEYGYPGDSIHEIRRKLPEFLKSQNRAVTGSDYQILASQFMSPYNGSIGKATAVLRNHGCAGNVIDIIVLAQTGLHRLTEANNNLKAELLEYLNTKKVFTDYLCIKDGKVILVDITIDVFLDKTYKKVEQSLHNRIMELLAYHFALPNWDFGKPLRTSDIIKSLSDVKEIRHMEVTFLTPKTIDSNEGNVDMVSTSYNEIIRPDNISLNFTYKMQGEA
jgi:hypothetical protein